VENDRMHIPDNFLSTPVWATFDAISIPAIGWLASRATRQLEDSRIPLLGVMGAFVFAAQMVNFPVGVGTSGHLVGGALLAFTLGPAAASIVMTAILAIQALVFQDGGVLALGANVFNMAIVGVLAGYLPFRLWGPTRAAIFGGAFLSVLASATLALSELLISGVPMPRPALQISLALFTISALIEGAITLTVLQAIGRINPDWIRKPGVDNRKTLLALGSAALVLVAAGLTIASTQPDGIEHILPDYTAPMLANGWLQKTASGLAGLLLIYGTCLLLAKLMTRRRSA
jgi:cobalt/nickel transport system permease protein